MKILILISTFLILGGGCVKSKSKSKSKSNLAPSVPLLLDTKGETTPEDFKVAVYPKKKVSGGDTEIVEEKQAIDENDLPQDDAPGIKIDDLKLSLTELIGEVQRLFDESKSENEVEKLSKVDKTKELLEVLVATAKRDIATEKNKDIYTNHSVDDNDEFEPLIDFENLETGLDNLLEGEIEKLLQQNPIDNEQLVTIIENCEFVLEDYKAVQANKKILNKDKNEDELHILPVLKTLYVIGELVKEHIK